MYLYPNNRKIFLNIWDTVANPKGVIQIIHGMSEYGARYEQFAHYFNLKGYIVIANDHYGHNNSIESYFGELPQEGFNIFVEDEFCKKFSTKEKLFVNCKMKIVWLK